MRLVTRRTDRDLETRTRGRGEGQGHSHGPGIADPGHRHRRIDDVVRRAVARLRLDVVLDVVLYGGLHRVSGAGLDVRIQDPHDEACQRALGQPSVVVTAEQVLAQTVENAVPSLVSVVQVCHVLTSTRIPRDR